MTTELAKGPEIAQLGIPTRTIERMAFLVAKESTGEMVASASALVGGLRPQSTELGSASHNKALGETIRTGDYEAMLQTFAWSVASGPAIGAILPDCVSIGLGSEGIAGNHLLVGRTNYRHYFLQFRPKGCSSGTGQGSLCRETLNSTSRLPV